MKIVIAGGTGFLGKPLTEALARDGHTLVHLSRGQHVPIPSARRVIWDPDGTAGPWASELSGADVVVNLAGESIAGHRWTVEQKRRILDSRIRSTASLVAAMGAATSRPAVFVSASAVGYYGPLDDRMVTESDPAGTDFLAGVCVTWEAEALKAAALGVRVVCIRTGLVLERDGGALPPMLLPFWFGAGGPVGSGRQFWPWIHRQDWIDLVRLAIATPGIAGPLNAVGPDPVTNREFARALGRAMRRPAFMPAPAFAIKLLLGEMGEALVLSGQRAVPEKAKRLGFTFKYETLDQALLALFR